MGLHLVGLTINEKRQHIGGAVSQTHSFVLVMVIHSIGQLHAELVTLAIQGFWLESQLVAKMELLWDFCQAR